MRGTVAKRLRKIVYGTDYSFRVRTYMRHMKLGIIKCSCRRRQYQDLKKAYKLGNQGVL